VSGLDARMRRVLAQMELFLSYGTTQAFDATGSRNKATGGDRPSGDAHPVHELYAAMYTRARTDSERLGVCEEAEREFERLRQQARPAIVEPGSLHWKREIANSDEPMERVLKLYSISRASYFRYRRDYRK